MKGKRIFSVVQLSQFVPIFTYQSRVFSINNIHILEDLRSRIDLFKTYGTICKEMVPKDNKSTFAIDMFSDNFSLSSIWIGKEHTLEYKISHSET